MGHGEGGRSAPEDLKGERTEPREAESFPKSGSARRRKSPLAEHEDDINDIGIAIEQAVVAAASEAVAEGSDEAAERLRCAVEALRAVDVLLAHVRGAQAPPPGASRLSEHREIVGDAVAVLRRMAATMGRTLPPPREDLRLAEQALESTTALAAAFPDSGSGSVAYGGRAPSEALQAGERAYPQTMENPVETLDFLWEFAPQWVEASAVALADGESPEAVERLRSALTLLQRARQLNRALRPEVAEEPALLEFGEWHGNAMREIMDALEGIAAAAGEDAASTGYPADVARLRLALQTLEAMDDFLRMTERPSARRARMQPHRQALREAERVLVKATVSAATAYVAQPGSRRARRYFRLATQALHALGTLVRELQAEWEQTGDSDDVEDDSIESLEDEAPEATSRVR